MIISEGKTPIAPIKQSNVIRRSDKKKQRGLKNSTNLWEKIRKLSAIFGRKTFFFFLPSIDFLS